MKTIKQTVIYLSLVCFLFFSLFSLTGNSQGQGTTERLLTGPGVAILNIDVNRPVNKIDSGVYGQFLEHINHSVVDGLFAEQVQGRGFEGTDFETYWKTSGEKGAATVIATTFKNGEKSLQLKAEKGTAGIIQSRIYLQGGKTYSGSMWVNNIEGSLKLAMRFKDSTGVLMKEIPLKVQGKDWQEVPFSFVPPKTDTRAKMEIEAKGTGTLLVDFISMMRADLRKTGMLRPDLVEALDGLKAPFIRWPGGSYASVYLWKDGIGPQVSRKYHPNTIWGGYSDYYGFGTDEFMELCRQLKTEPLICLPATTTSPEAVKYAMDWVHYLNDPATTEMGKLRASYGHPEPYNVKYFQIDNEPMNHGFTPEQYANIVNVYGSELRKITPAITIVACGQKRSNDLSWSQKIIDLAGANFDILGCHNYEYEPENYQTGLFRIEDYLIRLRDYVRNSKHPEIKLAVLEWGLCRSYDWRMGLHTAGSLMIYEKLGKELTMTCPALLLRNTTDNPTWTSFIYHDHVSWFPGGGYVVEKLFREHFAENYLASASGTFRDITNRKQFFDNISQMNPQDWKPGSLDAVATGSADGRRVVIKVVNYENNSNTLLTRLQGSTLTDSADVKIYTLKAGLLEKASIENPGVFKVVESTAPYAKDMAFVIEPYAVVVIDIAMK
jgi:alpha-N-arabinofuranosidase